MARANIHTHRRQHFSACCKSLFARFGSERRTAQHNHTHTRAHAQQQYACGTVVDALCVMENRRQQWKPTFLPFAIYRHSLRFYSSLYTHPHYNTYHTLSWFFLFSRVFDCWTRHQKHQHTTQKEMCTLYRTPSAVHICDSHTHIQLNRNISLRCFLPFFSCSSASTPSVVNNKLLSSMRTNGTQHLHSQSNKKQIDIVSK